MRLIAANWKMNPQTLEEARHLAATMEQSVLGLIADRCEVVICPPFVYTVGLKHALHHVLLGAQNVSAEEKGPFTGEISALQLKNLGLRYVIVGHSERRALGEDDKSVNKKLMQCFAHDLQPILCVGYGTTKNTSLQVEKRIITRQLQNGFRGLKFAKGQLTVAYEPAWTISKGPGTAKPITPERAAQVIEFIKSKYKTARVIYGASITAKNAPELARYKSIEGGLVGGASLNAKEFMSIVKSFILDS